MTGNPYALYVHVRARDRVGADAVEHARSGSTCAGTTAPESITPDVPGLVRWRPVEGATSYQVWFVDAGKVVTTATNVADEREYYTFHPDAALHGDRHVAGSRGARDLRGAAERAADRDVGPWSATFVSTNPAVTNGPISLDQTASDVTGTAAGPVAHALTPAFAWTGDTATNGISAPALPRVRRHRPPVREHRLQGLDRRQPRLRAAHERPLVTAGLARRPSPLRRRARRSPTGRRPAPTPPTSGP